ncbi:ThiF family adenylyltransferase [Mangrovibacterium lignilyticum]|uniref:ThiF family adenylyltransferase n=1 Tax=Mangrovibacterium lignilyticum TaxID=2668052 RepID=UPI0013D565C6|nr:ThiF family adenylyltransferase [Mangrovibacterium lignilyticum]
MSQVLINRSSDLLRLQNENYEIEVCGGYLVIHHIPYLNRSKEIKSGLLVMSLTTSGNIVGKPGDHTAYFVGERPCNINGSFVPSLVNSPRKQLLVGDIVSDFFLSCHPDGRKYTDYYDKVTTYASIISSPALNLDKEACDKIKRPIVVHEDDSPMAYMDTNASRANVTFLNELFRPLKIALVGVGGTGSYILDFISKTPVKEIHLYDLDVFNTHNAFRAPGAASVEELEEQLSKVEYLARRYSKMHTRIIPHKEHITPDNIDVLKEMNYIFLSVDSVCVRKEIGGYLIDKGLSFIDSGLGVNLSENKLSGLVRITSGFPGRYGHIKEAFGGDDAKDDVYASNIQIAELNALAAIHAIIRWKKMLGFYHDITCEANSMYSINDNDLLNE